MGGCDSDDEIWLDCINEKNNNIGQIFHWVDGSGETMSNDLFSATQEGDGTKVTALLDAGANVNTTDSNGMTPLGLATLLGHVGIMTALLDAGANVNAASGGVTPLFIAAMGGRVDIVTALLNAGVNVNATSGGGATSLGFAAKEGHGNIVTALLDAGANVNATDSDGVTPLFLAVQGGHGNIVTALLDAGANIDKGNAEIPQAKAPLSAIWDVGIVDYFEDLLPTADGECSDNQCPCSPSTCLPRGTGYLYVSQEVVDMRQDARTVQELEKKLNRLVAQAEEPSLVIFDRPLVTGILVCEQAAKLRCLDLQVAAADAQHWWQTGKIPLRATPLKPEADQNVSDATSKADETVPSPVEHLSQEATEQQYFEGMSPASDVLCSDYQCPCSTSSNLSRGEGYAYISKQTVCMRRGHITVAEMQAAQDNAVSEYGDSVRSIYENWVTGCALFCENGAKLKGIDLDVARKDALRWWNTGRLPLRPSPLAPYKAVWSTSNFDVKEVSRGEDTPKKLKEKKKRWWQWWRSDDDNTTSFFSESGYSLIPYDPERNRIVYLYVVTSEARPEISTNTTLAGAVGCGVLMETARLVCPEIELDENTLISGKFEFDDLSLEDQKDPWSWLGAARITYLQLRGFDIVDDEYSIDIRYSPNTVVLSLVILVSVEK